MTVETLDHARLAARIEDLLSVERKVIGASGELYDKAPWGRGEFLAERKGKDALSCVVLEGALLAGFSIAYEFDAEYAHISRFAVAPESASKGYGSALLDHQLKLMAQRGCRRCSVDLIARNAGARRLYESRGFFRLVGPGLTDYIRIKKRVPDEYLGDEPSHIAMLRQS
jgi:ribosomal protein S18 acetylase RimI-like enzyme